MWLNKEIERFAVSSQAETALDATLVAGAGLLAFALLLHAGVTTAGLALAHLAVAAGRPASYAPTRIGLGLAGAVVVAFFAAVTVPAVPMALLVLPPLLGVLWLTLLRSRMRRPAGSILARFAVSIRPRNLALLALMPLAATAVYALTSGAVPEFGFVHPLFAAMTSLVGLILFARAIAAVSRRAA